VRNTARRPTLCIATLGCKVNKADTELMQQVLTAQGYELVPFEQGADTYIINTCTVTAKSDFQSRQMVRRALRQNRQARVVVTGCYAQINPVELKQIPGVSLILSNRDKARVGEYLRPIVGAPSRREVVSGFCNRPCESRDIQGVGKTISRHNAMLPAPARLSRQDAAPTQPHSLSSYTRAFVKIQDGCNWACTYCIVPQARGKSRSLPLAEIVSQARQLVARGYKELVLTGIHIGHYGLDLSPKNKLAQLLAALSRLEGLGRIRLSSLEPTEFSQDMVKTIQENDKICPHFHIPLQSADDGILRGMGRRYGFARYQELILKLRELFPRAALGSDVIVGFPGEDEASFQTSYQRIAQLPLTYLHVFSYSKRPNTVAAKLPRQVNKGEKKSRSLRLRELGRQKKLSFYQSQLQQTRPSLILNQRCPESGRLVGLSDNYINILIDADDNLINQLLPLRITEVRGEQVFGEIVPSSLGEEEVKGN